ncbi:MAG: 16S rRNA (guanine(966)-N(2))-methyltransferase RsmD [Clostridia bacterium]|nr:16S rRNA (guanine(966)-N(2))-methyltransferase RsmD [Clostridia bacterium]
MRIIAGKYRGRKLNTPNGQDVRPTSDRVRENIFNIIQWRIAGSAVLDLFAGTGAMGIEAISRGATAVFNDKDMSSVALIKDNLIYLNEKAEVFNLDYAAALSRLKGRQFDTIFLDPPYALDATNVINIINENKLLKKNGLIVYEHSAEKQYEYTGFTVADSRKYGTVAVDFLEEK